MPSESTLFLMQSDTVLEKIITILPEPAVESTNDVFFDLMSCIIEQQIHCRSTKKIFQKMLDAASLSTLTPDNFHAFEQTLSGANLAMGKYETVLAILEFWKETPVNWQLLSDAEVRTKLAAIRGIGKWTTDMILLYSLQRPNVFPADDFHLKQVMVSLYGLNENIKLKSQMLALAEKWGRHQSLAVKYLLAWKNFNKKTIQ